MTNLDRIHAMTEDELIEWYCRRRWCGQCPYNTGIECSLREWLRKEKPEIEGRKAER